MWHWNTTAPAWGQCINLNIWKLMNSLVSSRWSEHIDWRHKTHTHVCLHRLVSISICAPWLAHQWRPTKGGNLPLSGPNFLHYPGLACPCQPHCQSMFRASWHRNKLYSSQGTVKSFATMRAGSGQRPINRTLACSCCLYSVFSCCLLLVDFAISPAVRCEYKLRVTLRSRLTCCHGHKPSWLELKCSI